jgi:hypothetical protein
MVALSLLSYALLLAESIRLGEPAPALTVQARDGRRVQLAAYRGRSAVLLLADREFKPADLEAAAAILKPLNTEIAFLGDFPQPATILIDKTGTVRRIRPGEALSGPSLEDFVRQWHEGKSVFEASCARCHGEDGALHICADVKPLTGIGNRLTPDEIRKRLRIAEVNDREVVIRATFFKRHEVDALLAYIAGL